MKMYLHKQWQLWKKINVKEIVSIHWEAKKWGTWWQSYNDTQIRELNNILIESIYILVHKERVYNAILRTVCIAGKLRQQRQSIILMTIIWEKKKIKYVNKYDCGIVYVFRRKWILLWIFNIFLKKILFSLQ